MDEFEIKQRLKQGVYLMRAENAFVYFLYKESLAFYAPNEDLIKVTGLRQITKHCAYSSGWNNIVDRRLKKATEDVIKIIEAELSKIELESI